MIPSLKRPLTYILTAIFTLIGVGVPFLVFGITKATGNAPFPYYYLHLMFACLYALFAYVFGDIVLVTYRRKNPSAMGEVSPEANLKIWTLRWPFIFSLLILLILFAVFYIIFAVTHSWPLM